MSNERKCLECGDTLRGRADQKFCGVHCRSSFNNKRLSATNNTIRRINRILRKNQLILSHLNPKGKTTVSKTELNFQGFHFGYQTHVQTTRQGRVYYYIYDQGYSLVDADKVMLVHKQE